MGCSTTKYYLKIKKLYVVEQRPKEKKLTSVLLHNHWLGLLNNKQKEK